MDAATLKAYLLKAICCSRVANVATEGSGIIVSRRFRWAINLSFLCWRDSVAATFLPNVCSSGSSIISSVYTSVYLAAPCSVTIFITSRLITESIRLSDGRKNIASHKKGRLLAPALCFCLHYKIRGNTRGYVSVVP